MNHLFEAFVRGLQASPENAAVLDGNTSATYAELDRAMRRLALVLSSSDTGKDSLGAMLMSRGVPAYAAILALLCTGRGCVPIHPRVPVLRAQDVLSQACPDVLITDASAVSHVRDILIEHEKPISVFVVNGEVPTDWPADHAIHRVDLTRGPEFTGAPVPQSSDTAYLLFTSGTTGRPKGVPVSQGNVSAYLRAMDERLDLSPGQRVSQTFELTFDLSVHDLFVCWSKGACLVNVPDKVLAAPASFIQAHDLSHWFSVPSVAARMDRLGLLQPNTLRSLHNAIFCGEPLSADLVARWSQAAPNCAIHNFYGPTEATIAITGYTIELGETPQTHDGHVSIGTAFPQQCVNVVDEQGKPMNESGFGELYLGGSQITAGYLNNIAETSRRFKPDLTLNKQWFKSGDRAYRDPHGNLFVLGRLDEQVKVRGFRVELSEVDLALRAVTTSAEAMVIPWPSSTSADFLVGFVPLKYQAKTREIISRCRETLPDYMVPRYIEFLEEMPRQLNGKLDRNRLGELMREKSKEASTVA